MTSLYEMTRDGPMNPPMNTPANRPALSFEGIDVYESAFCGPGQMLFIGGNRFVSGKDGIAILKGLPKEMVAGAFVAVSKGQAEKPKPRRCLDL